MAMKCARVWGVLVLILCLQTLTQDVIAQASDDKAVNGLITSLLAAKTDAERQGLLDANKKIDRSEWTRAVLDKVEEIWGQGSYAPMLSLLDFARRQAEGAHDARGVDLVKIDIARIYFIQRHYPAAEALFRECLKGFESRNDKEDIVRSLYGIAETYRGREEYDQATPYYQRVLTEAREAKLLSWQAIVLNWLGECCRLHGDDAQAQEYYEQCLPIARQAGMQWQAGYALNNLGIVQMNQYDFTHALVSLQQALTIRRQLKDDLRVSDTLDNLGNLYEFQSNLPLALDYYQQALKLRLKSKDKAEVAGSYNNLGLVQTHLMNWSEAQRNYEQSLTLYKEDNNANGIAMVTSNIAYLHHAKGNEEYRESGFDAARADLSQALNYYRQVLDRHVKDNSWTEQVLLQMADVYTMEGDELRSLDYVQRAIAIAESYGDTGRLELGWTIAGSDDINLKRYDQAQQALEKAISAGEAFRTLAVGGEAAQQQLFEGLISPYQHMAELRVLQGRPADALVYAERAKARTLLDVLQRGKVSITRAMTPQERAEEQHHNQARAALNIALLREQQSSHPDPARLADLKTRRDQAQRDYEAFRLSLYAAHPDLQAQRGEARTIQLTEIRDLLADEHCAAIEFLVYFNRTMVYTITHGAAGTTQPEVHVYTIPLRASELARRVEAFRERVSDPNRAVSADALDLYRLLLKPAASQLQGKTTFILVPDGPLWDLPFQALQPRQGRYLLQDATIYYAPSITALREMRSLRRHRSAPAGGRVLLAFGNPALGATAQERVQVASRGGRLVPLPEAEREVKTLEQIYSAPQCRIYIGEEAQKARALTEAGSYHILHFATHALLDDANPLYSCIVLSQTQTSKEDDGLLEGREILDLDLKADLAVLSACETARGQIREGEGVIGLSWALFIAGCPTTVVSQWEVDSPSTTALMLGFHRLRHSGKPTAQALREAALSLAKQSGREHPFYWAGFVTVGDGS